MVFPFFPPLLYGEHLEKRSANRGLQAKSSCGNFSVWLISHEWFLQF